MRDVISASFIFTFHDPEIVLDSILWSVRGFFLLNWLVGICDWRMNADGRF